MSKLHNEFSWVERHMQGIAKAVAKRIPKTWGFAVIVFPFDTYFQGTCYVSNARREDMIKALKETVLQLEFGEDHPPGVDPRIYDGN